MRIKHPFLFAVIPVAGLLCLAAGFVWANRMNQPIVSCPSAPQKSVSNPPASLASARDYFEQGDYEYEQGNCDQAIADYSRAIELNPKLAEAYNNRAYVHMVKKEYGAALGDLNQALQLRPDYVNALMNRGDIYNYYYAIDYQRAVADYDQVLRIDPHAAEHSSVCGHRLLALNHGWTPNVLGALLRQGVTAGCP